LGYMLLAVAVIFVCVCATDLYIAQKRLDSLADAAALAGADGFTLQADGDAVHAELTDEGVHEQAAAVVAVVAHDARLVSAGTPGGVGAGAPAAGGGPPPLLPPSVPGGGPRGAPAPPRPAPGWPGAPGAGCWGAPVRGRAPRGGPGPADQAATA